MEDVAAGILVTISRCEASDSARSALQGPITLIAMSQTMNMITIPFAGTSEFPLSVVSGGGIGGQRPTNATSFRGIILRYHDDATDAHEFMYHPGDRTGTYDPSVSCTQMGTRNSKMLLFNSKFTRF